MDRDQRRTAAFELVVRDGGMALGRVTVAGKPSDDLAPGTLNSVLKQAGLKR